MTTIEEARQSLVRQREATATAKTQLEEVRQSVPVPTAKLLRQGAFSGIAGRLRTQQVQRVKGAIGEQSENISQYEGQLGEYETQINQAEVQQRQAEQQQAQYRYALEVYLGIKNAEPSNWATIPQNIRNLASAQAQKLEPVYNPKDVMAKYVADFESKFPTEKLILDRSGTKIAGITSGSFGMSLQGTTEYNKMIQDINKKVADVSIPSYRTDVSYKTPISDEMFPLISAKSNIPEPSFTGRIVATGKNVYETGKNLFFSIVGKGFQADVPTYIPSVNVTQVSASPYTYGSINVQQPQYRYIAGDVTQAEQSIPSIDAGKLTGVSSKDYNRATNRMRELEVNLNEWDKYSKLDEKGEPVFTGTEEQYNNYLKDIEEYEKNKKIVSRKFVVGGGLGFKGRAESIQKYSGLYSDTGVLPIDVARQASALTSLGGATTMSLIGESFSRGYNALTGGNIFFKEEVVPEGSYTSVAPYSGGTMQYDVLTGKPIIWKETTVQSFVRPAITSEEIGKGMYKTGSFAVDIGKYAIPYAGLTFFGGEVAGRLSEYNYNPIGFVKENPVEAGLTGLAIFAPITYKVGKKVFTPEFLIIEEKAPVELLALGGKGKGRNVMSRISNEITAGGKTTILRGFEGIGIGESAVAGRRVLYQSPFQKFFRLKPTYSGNIYGETLAYAEKMGLPSLPEKILTISKKEAGEGYLKALKNLEKRGLTESQARSYLRRYKPSYQVSKAEYDGVMATQFGAGKPLTRIGIQGVRKEIPIKQPLIVNLGKDFSALTFSKGGNIKKIDVTTGMEELKTIIPKGAAAGGLGELTLFKGGSKEFNPLGKLGNKIREFKEGAVAKKAREISLGEEGQLGKIEFYKTGSISKEITLNKPRKISTEVSDIEVINPAIRKEIKLNYEEGIFSVEKFGLIGKNWGSIAKVEVPISVREEFKGLIHPAKIKKTPLSKTFGQVLEIPKPILKKPIQEGKLIAEETSKLIKNIPKRAIPKLKELSKLNEVEYLPLMVGGGGRGISLYAGTGQYEVQDLGAITINVPLQKTFLEVKPTQENLLFTGQQFKQTQLETLKTNLKMNEILKVKEKLKLNEMFKTNEILKFQEKLKLNERLNEMFKLNEKSKLKEKLGMVQRITQKQKEKLKQPIKITQKWIPRLTPTASKINMGLIKSGFEKIKAFGKRFGKDILLGEFKTEAEATKKLKGFLTGTLGASGYVEKGGRKLKIDLGQGFRKSKAEPLRVVQEKGYRLSARPETSEIQSERRKNRRTWKL